MNIKVVRANRGFWNDLFSISTGKINFIKNNKVRSTEDIRGNSKKLLYKLSQLKVFDYLGIFQEVIVNDKEKFDAVFSYNRFVRTTKPYIIGVENPTAMVHYHAKRATSILGRFHVSRVLRKTNLRAFCCLSKACQSTMRNYYKIPQNIEIYQIYPYIKDRITEDEMRLKVEQDIVNCLFISSDFNLKGGNELWEAIKQENLGDNSNIHFDFITKLDTIRLSTKEEMMKSKNVNLYDYNFTKSELNDFYKKANIFINMTRMDSFSLVTLEALNYGCAFIATDMYALREMIYESMNGYLTKPSIQIWNEDLTKNEGLSHKEKRLLYSDKSDRRIIEFVGEKIKLLLENRDTLVDMQNKSYELSRTVFNNSEILRKWHEVFVKLEE